MDINGEAADARTPAASEVSDNIPVSCAGSAEAREQKKITPQQRKQEKIVARIEEMTGTRLPFLMAEVVNDVIRTGLRVTDKEEEEAKGYRKSPRCASCGFGAIVCCSLGTFIFDGRDVDAIAKANATNCGSFETLR